MAYDIQVSRLALADIDEIYDYLFTHFSESVAEEKVRYLIRSYTRLAVFPLFGEDATNIHPELSGYQYLIVEKNIVFYSIDHGGKMISVLRIYPQRKDYIRRVLSYLKNRKENQKS